VREAYADCAIAFNGNAEIASSLCLTAAALVGSNVIAGAFSRSPYVALDDIFGQVRFPFSCFFLYAALPPMGYFGTKCVVNISKAIWTHLRRYKNEFNRTSTNYYLSIYLRDV